jgi:hypothetical protein
VRKEFRLGNLHVLSTKVLFVFCVLFPSQTEGQNLKTEDVSRPVQPIETADTSWRSRVPSLFPPGSSAPTDANSFKRLLTLSRTLQPVGGAYVGSSTSFWRSLRELYGNQPLETPPEELEAAPLPEKVEPIDRSNLRSIERNKGYFLPLGDALFYYDRSGKSRGYRKATSIYRSAYDRSSVSLGDSSRSSRGSRSPRNDAGRSAQSRR